VSAVIRRADLLAAVKAAAEIVDEAFPALATEGSPFARPAFEMVLRELLDYESDIGSDIGAEPEP
jgi:hypothetical protein